jgi:hypothetical protein
VSNNPQMAAITCARCGVHGRLERAPYKDTVSAFLDDDAFRQFCKSPEPGLIAGCPYWDDACRAAVPQLKAQSAH